jgi:hypothetical protein
MELLAQSEQHSTELQQTKSTITIFKQAVGLSKPEQESAAVALVRSVTLPVALEKGQQLGAALANPETAAAAKTQIRVMVDDVFKFFGAFDDTKELRLEIIRTINAQFSNLNIEEIALVFQRGKNGDFGKEGKPFGKLNGSHVLYWLNTYMKGEERAGYWERENRAGSDEYVEIYEDEKDEQGNKTGRKKLVNRYRAGAAQNEPEENGFDVLRLLVSKTTPGPDGVVAFSPDAAQPPLTRAQQLRAEADRLENDERLRLAGIAAKRERDTAALLAGEDTSRLIEKSAEEFKAFAIERYYSKLTQQERDIIKAAEEGLLSAEIQPIYLQLCQRWQTIVLEWEARPLAPIISQTK